MSQKVSILHKNPGFIIDGNDPYKNDELSRKPLIIKLTRLIEGLTQPFTLAIDAPWGCGKTTFIKMWKAELAKANYKTLYINAWEKDFTENPLVTLVAEISEQLEDTADTSVMDGIKNSATKLIRSVTPCLTKVAGKILSQATVGVSETVFDSLSATVENAVKQDLQNYKEYKSSLENLEEFLTEFANSFTEKGGKLPIVIFIDELDRCRPIYAIKLLESIKHLFHINNYLFVLSTDATQLKESIKAVYGQGFDTDTYLRRFFDLTFLLPSFFPQGFLQSLHIKFNLDTLLTEKNCPYRGKYTFINCFSALAKDYSLTLREIEQCFSQYAITIRMNYADGKDFFPILLAILLILKIKNPPLYKGYCTAGVQSTAIDVFLQKLPNIPPYKEVRLWASIGNQPDYKHQLEQMRGQNLPREGFDELLYLCGKDVQGNVAKDLYENLEMANYLS